MPFIDSKGKALAYTWELTFDGMIQHLHEGKGLLSLSGYCIQNLPDHKCDSKTDLIGAGQRWMSDIPYAYNAGKAITPRVYDDWKARHMNQQENKPFNAVIRTPGVSITTPKFTWSYSALNDFENCPLGFAHKRFYRDNPPEPERDYLIDGNLKHKAFEKALKGEALFANEEDAIRPYMHYVDALKNASVGGELHAEMQMCLNEQLKPTDWFGVDAWGRGVIDVCIIKGDEVWIYDWKTGKPKEDPTQLKVFCAFLGILRPELQTFTAKCIWLKDPKAGNIVKLTRSDLVGVWQELLGRVTRMRQAWDSEVWAAKPSGLCPYCGFVDRCQYRR